MMNIENLMREFEKRQLVKSRTAFPFLSLLAVSACGGGGSGGSSPAPADPITGAVIKGPLQNAFVFLDFNDDGEHQVGIEPSTSTDADGSYSFTNVAASDATATVVAKTDSTTIDKSSGEILDNVVLKAPSGSSVVTPATTIMKEAGITKEEVSKVLGLPDGVDPTSFNPYGAGVDAATALAVEKVAQQVMTTITAVSSAVEGAGASSSDAFAVALGTVVDIVKDKAAVVQANPAAAVEVLDLSKPEEIAQVTAKVSEKIETTAGVTKADFDAVKADLDVAVQNVNTKITAVTDLTSAESMAAFAVATELKTQVKAATEAKGDPAVSITFTDTDAIETATTSKATDIQEAIDAGDVVTAPEPEPVAGADYTLGTADNIQATIDGAVDVDGDGKIVIALTGGRYAQDFTIDKSIEIWGAAKGLSISEDGNDYRDGNDTLVDEVEEVNFDLENYSRGVNETWIDGTVTVAHDQVLMDGLRLHTYDGALKFAGSDIDYFTLQNSYVTGFHAQDSFRYYDDDGIKSKGWLLDGNLIGGVSGGVGGSLYLTGIEDSLVVDNVFWRPGAAHMYIEDVTNVKFESNFFLQGLHADGANQDGLYGELIDADNWGYAGFSGGGGPDGYGPEIAGSGILASVVYYGRNYVAEVKGVTDGVQFVGNTAKYNSGGIQFWDENSTANYFTNTVISDNVFTDFFNADPNGVLSQVESRHESSLAGGVIFSVLEGSSSSSLKIVRNKIEGSIDQVMNENDLDSLVLVQGGVDSVEISQNLLSWTGSNLSMQSSEFNGGETGAGFDFKVFTQGIHLLGNVGAKEQGNAINILNNIFDTDTITENYASDAILIDLNDYSSIGFGKFSSAVAIFDQGYSSLADYAKSQDFGNYADTNLQIDQYGTVMASGSGDLLVTYGAFDL